MSFIAGDHLLILMFQHLSLLDLVHQLFTHRLLLLTRTLQPERFGVLLWSMRSQTSASQNLVPQVHDVPVHGKIRFSPRPIVVFELTLHRFLSELQLAQLMLTLPHLQHVVQASVQVLIPLLLKLLNALQRSKLIAKLVVQNHSFKQVSLEKDMVSQHPLFYL